jgi:hypothetical protein
MLRLRIEAVAAAAGTSHLTLELTNDGPRPCSVEGYPVVAFFGESGAGGAGAGARLDVRDLDLGSSPQQVTVEPHAAASFVLSVAEVPVNGVGCSQATSLQVVPPGGGAAISVPAAFEICGGTVGVFALTGP